MERYNYIDPIKINFISEHTCREAIYGSDRDYLGKENIMPPKNIFQMIIDLFLLSIWHILFGHNAYRPYKFTENVLIYHK